MIERIARRAAARPATAAPAGRAVQVGIGDDCAVLRLLPGTEAVVTTDFSLEGRHFRRDWHTPQSAGHRCLARGLSDLAAMGAQPIAAFLSLALPAGYGLTWVDGFLDGLFALADVCKVQLAGGDTAQAPGDQILADIVCVGAVRRGRGLLRSGARAGDRLYVTGSLGGAAEELRQLAAGQQACPTSAAEAEGAAPQSFPQPRLAAGAELARRRLATACMDLSDGLATDLLHLCQAAGLDAEIDPRALPLGRGATLQQALTGGEDYELLFTAAPEKKMPRLLGGVPLTGIGRMLPVRDAQPAIWSAGERLDARGWEHFREAGPSTPSTTPPGEDADA